MSGSFSLLSNVGIERHMEAGNIIIFPFRPANLKTGSYDVRLGPHYYKQVKTGSGSISIINPWSEDAAERMWGKDYCSAQSQENIFREYGVRVSGLKAREQVIVIPPSETILAHTIEYIGGTNCIIPLMHTRSSIGRFNIETCKCAGWGDVGYFSRWTMEITNSSLHHHLALPVGRRVAQIIFFEVEPPHGGLYPSSGKYQVGATLEEVMQKWSPLLLLPKLYLDPEVG